MNGDQTQSEPITMDTETPVSEDQLTAEHRAWIKSQRARFQDTEDTLARNRAFFEKHLFKLLRIGRWSLYGFSDELDFSVSSRSEAAAIAKEFGAEGWSRKTDYHICGRINWHKTVDGVNLKISGAEMIKPTIREHVRINENGAAE